MLDTPVASPVTLADWLDVDFIDATVYLPFAVENGACAECAAIVASGFVPQGHCASKLPEACPLCGLVPPIGARFAGKVYRPSCACAL